MKLILVHTLDCTDNVFQFYWTLLILLIMFFDVTAVLLCIDHSYVKQIEKSNVPDFYQFTR